MEIEFFGMKIDLYFCRIEVDFFYYDNKNIFFYGIVLYKNNIFFWNVINMGKF